MTVVMARASWWQRLRPVLAVFDGPLLLAVLAVWTIGLVAMYSAGFDFGGRFTDHARNMAIALVVMFATAQVPPQQLMRLAVPLYVLGVALLVATMIFGITKKGATRWLHLGIVIQPSEVMKLGRRWGCHSRSQKIVKTHSGC